MAYNNQQNFISHTQEKFKKGVLFKEWLFNRTLGSFHLVTCHLCYTAPRVAIERTRAWRMTCGRFAWPVLEVVDIIWPKLCHIAIS